jgi:hypothetical protein
MTTKTGELTMKKSELILNALGILGERYNLMLECIEVGDDIETATLEFDDRFHELLKYASKHNLTVCKSFFI